MRRAALYLLDQPPLATLRFVDLVQPLGDSDPGVGLASSTPGRGLRVEPFLPFRSQLRQPAVLGIDDERSAANRCAAVPPELVIGEREIRVLVLRPVVTRCPAVGLRVEVLFLLFAEQFLFTGTARALGLR